MSVTVKIARILCLSVLLSGAAFAAEIDNVIEMDTAYCSPCDPSEAYQGVDWADLINLNKNSCYLLEADPFYNVQNTYVGGASSVYSFSGVSSISVYVVVTKPNPNPAAFILRLYRDNNCDGVIDSGDTLEDYNFGTADN